MRLKLRRIGNSQGVYLPKEMVGNYKIGDYIDLEVREVITKPNKPLIKFNSEWCPKHDVYKGSCGC